MYDPLIDKQIIKHPRQEILIAKTTSRVTQTTQEEEIIKIKRTLIPIPTPHTKSTYKYQDQKYTTTLKSMSSVTSTMTNKLQLSSII